MNNFGRGPLDDDGQTMDDGQWAITIAHLLVTQA